MLCRNLSVTFWVTVEISYWSVVLHKNFLSLFLFPPYPAKTTPKISLCGTKFWPRYCSWSIHPELLISSTWTPGLGLSVLSCPQTSCKNLLCGSLRSPSSVFTAAVFQDSTDAFLHPWPLSLLLTFLIASRHQLGSPLIPALAGVGLVALQDWRMIRMPMDNGALLGLVAELCPSRSSSAPFRSP